jgi:hypothetical protein
MPPITFPGIGDIVVTDSFRLRLEAAAFRGVSFQPVIKAHVVNLPWHTWDRSAELPPEMPESGEPEDFLLGAPHSPETAEMLGDLWEVILPVAAGVERLGHGGDQRIVLALAGWKGEELFRAEGVLYRYVSERAQEWFLAEAAAHVDVSECEAR